MKISLPEELWDVEVNEKWGQEVFINDLVLYVRQFIKHALEEAIRQELTEFLGYEQYQRGNGRRDNNRNGYYERDLLTRFGPIEGIQVARRPGPLIPEFMPQRLRHSHHPLFLRTRLHAMAVEELLPWGIQSSKACVRET